MEVDFWRKILVSNDSQISFRQWSIISTHHRASAASQGSYDY